MIRERENTALPGLPVAIGLHHARDRLRLRPGPGGARGQRWSCRVSGGAAILFAVFLLAGLFIVNPNEGKVLQLFGRYAGTVKQPGLRWANPFYTKKRISQRIRNFESSHLKVNDNEGNPIEIAAVVVWHVVDTAEAVFEVDDYNNYVKVQTEAALRNLATSYTYDTHDEAQMSLRGHTAAVAEHLKNEIQDRLAKAGVEVIEARISHLAYAQEIAARDAAAPAGRRHHRRPPAHRRRRRRHGRDGARDAVADATSSSSTTSARRRWSATCWSCCAATSRRSRSSTPGRSTSSDAVADRKPFLLRIDRELLDAVQRWADDDLRSLNGQIEFLLRRALTESGRE